MIKKNAYWLLLFLVTVSMYPMEQTMPLIVGKTHYDLSITKWENRTIGEIKEFLVNKGHLNDVHEPLYGDKGGNSIKLANGDKLCHFMKPECPVIALSIFSKIYQ